VRRWVEPDDASGTSPGHHNEFDYHDDHHHDEHNHNDLTPRADA